MVSHEKMCIIDNIEQERKAERRGRKMYDSIVIGSGIAGATAARKLAQEGNRNVLVIEKRSHIGGNCYDRKDSHGVLIHEYGPHIFHRY